MARPKKDNADYHTHDKDMRNDKKIKALRKKYKHEGYSVYNMMLEVLDNEDHFEHQWNDDEIELLAGDFDIETELLKEIINYCVKVKLFIIDNSVIYSNGHKNRFKPLLSKRKRDSNVVIVSDNPVTDTENPHSIVKDSIVKEKIIYNGQSASHLPTQTNNSAKAIDSKKEKKLPPRRNLPADLKEVDGYMFEKMKNIWDSVYISRVANKFFNFYEANGWKQGKGKPIVSWKHAANLWIFNDIDKSKTGGFAKIDHTQQRKEDVARGTILTEKRIPTPEEIEMMQLEFIEDTYKGFVSGEIEELELATGIYDLLTEKSLIILTAEEKSKILSECDNNSKLAKKRSLANYFKQLKQQNVNKVFQLVG